MIIVHTVPVKTVQNLDQQREEHALSTHGRCHYNVNKKEYVHTKY